MCRERHCIDTADRIGTSDGCSGQPEQPGDRSAKQQRMDQHIIEASRIGSILRDEQEIAGGRPMHHAAIAQLVPILGQGEIE